MGRASVALLLCLVPVACSTRMGTASPAASSPDGWAGQCYDGFAEDVDALAGPDAIDCGFHAGAGAKRGDIERWRACAREAAASGRPFKFGYRSVGIDSAFCDTAIRTADGALLSWFLDFDVNGGGGDQPAPALWASGCKRIAFEAGAIGPGRFFDLQECRELMSGRAWDVLQARIRR